MIVLYYLINPSITGFAFLLCLLIGISSESSIKRKIFITLACLLALLFIYSLFQFYFIEPLMYM
ncbi:MAG TPA: hypothetical protein DCZ10_02530 [Pelotomaculum sp.]|nr:hypothetical protein [Pelotomaculum sp.]